jgi:hypothetical protein
VRRWNDRVYSNNLYLELLTGSGLLGLLTFGILMGIKSWRSNAPSMAAAVFLIHGFVDVFLMATPIYFMFWIFFAMPETVPDHAGPSSSPVNTGVV